ncbi:galactose ABC transporter substrate-binding protein [Clostridium vincentii]|uniref:D-galactose/methyl-galactoside binding periplasmic protein MglB n=1 Tax=Clostridium vincentii TaxID=52704 RepID=A0A2T0BIX9_9CLOT|nr:galactose ABC transporter substrate-binding protein [Clostridium vincentii]PRR83807.1 D-galactose-binding periplasmic protein precursor [Clostridium vincentii]
MKLLKRLILLVISFMIITTLICNIQKNLYISSISVIATPPNVGVLLFNANDPYLSLVKQSLENIEKENPNKVRFSFYDANDNQAIQNETIGNLINNNIDLLLVNLVDTKQSTVSQIISNANIKNIPLVFFNIELPIDAKSSSNKVFVIATDSKTSGVMQGNILADLWNNNKNAIDKNNDNVLQYIMLQGKTNNEAAINRTIYSISSLNDNGIQTEELALIVCNWEQDCAKSAISSLFLKYAGRIEAILANNDAMAIGAIEALQSYGYNKGDKTKTIPVVGVDAIPEARELIAKGFMAGTVIQDPNDLANALYSIGLNLIYNRRPLEGTDYEFAREGVIEIPYYEYIP